MALTKRQLDRRQQSLGGSDIAVLMGHDQRKSQYDLWVEKKHGVNTFEGNDQTEFGIVVEGAITDWAAQQLKVRTRKNVFRAAQGLPFHANLDAQILDAPEAIEVKTTSYRVDEEWGEPGTDEMPHKVICQSQWQAGVADLDLVHVAAGLMPTFGGQKLRLFRTGRHEELIDRMFEIGLDWWNRYVEGDEIPPDLPSEETIKAIQRVPNFERVIDRDLVAELIQAKAEAKAANGLVKELTKQLHAALYDPETQQWAEVGVIDDDHRITYFQHYRKPEKEPRKGGFYRRLQLPKEL